MKLSGNVHERRDKKKEAQGWGRGKPPRGLNNAWGDLAAERALPSVKTSLCKPLTVIVDVIKKSGPAVLNAASFLRHLSCAVFYLPRERRGRVVKKAVFFIFLFVFLPRISPAEEQRFQLAAFGGVSHIFEYGSEEGSVQGKSDFPVMPAHTPPFFGLSFSYFLTESIKLELDGRHAFASKVKLLDPSDADSVEVNTAARSFASLNICYQCIRCNFRPYFLVGGGLNGTAAKERNYTTLNGYEIDFAEPGKKTALMVLMGWGMDLAIRGSAGVRLDVRFHYLFEKPDNIPVVFFGIGAYSFF